MKISLSWILSNGIILAMFICGQLYMIDFLIGIPVIVYWITAVGGTLFLFVPSKHIEKMAFNLDTSLVIDQLYDVVVIMTLIHFGYIWLPLFYAGHILGIHHMVTSSKQTSSCST